MSTRIDNLINSYINNPVTSQSKNDGKWYVAKPLSYGGIREYKNRIKDAWRILQGKSQAYHYEVDEHGYNN